MTVTLGAAAIVAVIGALAYGLSANAKVGQLGLVSFGCGLLALLLAVTR